MYPVTGAGASEGDDRKNVQKGRQSGNGRISSGQDKQRGGRFHKAKGFFAQSFDAKFFQKQLDI